MSRALPCAILAIDPGSTCGVALFLRGELVYHGAIHADSPEVETTVGHALEVANEHAIPLALIGEDWGAGGIMGIKQWQSLGAAWKRWEWALKALWLAHKEACKQRGVRPGHAPKVLRVHASTWKAAIYGRRLAKGTSKREAVKAANARHRLRLKLDQHDVAEAILIGDYAARADSVLALLGKRLLKKHGFGTESKGQGK